MLGFRVGNSVYDLLRKDNVVTSFSSGGKAGLVRVNEIREERF